MRPFLWLALAAALLAASCAIPTTGLIALDDQASVEFGGQVTIPVLLNDRPPPGETLGVTDVQGATGLVSIATDGSLAYIAPEGFSGLDQFTYTVVSDSSSPVQAAVVVSVGAEQTIPGDLIFPDVVIFGEVDVGDERVEPVVFTNPGPGPTVVEVPSVASGGSPDFHFIDSNCGVDLSAGAECGALIAFRPTDEGDHFALLLVNGEPRVELHGFGTVHPPNPGPEPNPRELEFGDVSVGDAIALPVRFTNPGPGPVLLAEPFIEHRGPEGFRIGDNGCRGELPEGESCGMDVVFQPAGAEPYAAILTLGDGPEVQLRGFGVEAPGGGCAIFDDLAVGTEYRVGDSFETAGIKVEVLPFIFGSGEAFEGGFTRVEDQLLSGGSGLDLQVNNVNLSFSFGTQEGGLIFLYGEYGGNLNLTVNEQFENFSTMSELNERVIGGVEVFVFPTFLGGDNTGFVTLVGDPFERGGGSSRPIDSFAIGGQELWIDDVCSPIPTVS